MSKRSFRKQAGDPFNQGETESGNTWIDTSSQIFGDLAAVDAATERIQLISIFDIIPDAQQPRRAAPSAVRQGWDGQARTVPDLLQAWWRAVEDERGIAFDLGAYLLEQDTERAHEGIGAHTPGPVEQSLLTVATLAASIRRDGLTNPITVAPASGQYRLETGERRWLAYHLLHAWFDGSEGRPDERATWAKIPARRVETVDVWRQASENNARADLNAIGKARQWAVLMMDLNGRQNFKPLTAFGSERAYYAQAIDLRVPYGKGEQLLGAMGVASRSALARYRALLKLPDAIWTGGDDLSLPEEQLYALARLPENEALGRFAQIVAGQNNPAARQSSTDAEAITAPGTKRHFSQVARYIKASGQGKHRHNAQALKAVRELRIWLEDQEDRIRRYLEE